MILTAAGAGNVRHRRVPLRNGEFAANQELLS